MVCSLLFGSSSSKYAFGPIKANQEQSLTDSACLEQDFLNQPPRHGLNSARCQKTLFLRHLKECFPLKAAISYFHVKNELPAYFPIVEKVPKGM